MTTVPEDMYNVVYVQLGVARDGLPADKLKDAIAACFCVLSEVRVSVSHECASQSVMSESVSQSVSHEWVIHAWVMTQCTAL